jgi:hypothetical protein
MKVSELIAALTEILEVDGDYPVYVGDEASYELEDVQINHIEHRIYLE